MTEREKTYFCMGYIWALPNSDPGKVPPQYRPLFYEGLVPVGESEIVALDAELRGEIDAAMKRAEAKANESR